jgi:ubiquinone/menaquinone biosynthesis C-methylase UbiE
VGRAVEPEYLRWQYSTTERLRIRAETHQRFSEDTDDWLEWVLDRVAPVAGERVVDIGCGTGAYHPSLNRRGVRVIAALDASSAMVEATQKQAVELGLPVVVLNGVATELPLPDDAYDVAMANHMLFHVTNQRAASATPEG